MNDDETQTDAVEGENDMLELGEVSKDTHGLFGWWYDGGGGRWPN